MNFLQSILRFTCGNTAINVILSIHIYFQIEDRIFTRLRC